MMRKATLDPDYGALDNTKARLNFEEKLQIFLGEVKDKPKFEEKVNSLFIAEFEEKIPVILTIKEMDFLTEISTGVKMILEDMYGPTVLDEKMLKEILAKAEKMIKTQYYQKNYKILSLAWNEYETNLKAIKKYSASNKNLKARISSKNNENFSFLKNYRRHCINTDQMAYHNCSSQSKMLEVWDESGKEASLTHVICVECKKCYLYNCILLYCSPCEAEYYSSVLHVDENPDIQQATWSKYHCGALINDRMKCIKCRSVFYLNLKTNMLVCLNENCKFEAKATSIAWSCMLCKKEFRCDAKIYNPMEFKFVKNAIKQVLLLKQKARPLSVPCCKINIYSRNFIHKKECGGDIFQGEFNKNIIVVCEKCKSMNFYDKYIWTCPKCYKRFKQKNFNAEEDSEERSSSVSLKDNISNMNNISNNNLINISHSTPSSKMPSRRESEKNIKGNLNVVQTKAEFYTPVKNLKSDYADLYDQESNANTETDVYKSNIKTQDDNSPVQTQQKKNVKPKTLIEILEERKSGKNVTQCISQNNKDPFAKKEDDVISTESITSVASSPNKLHRDSGKEKEELKLNVNIDKEENKKEIESKKSPSKVKKESDDRNNISSSNNVITINAFDAPDEEEKKKIVLKPQVKVTNNIVSNPDSKGSEGSKSSKHGINVNYSNSISSTSSSAKNNKLKEMNIDDFKIIKQIGEGSYGKIYLIEDKYYRKYALKKIIAHDKDDIASFKQEFELVNSVQHRNVMKIYGTCTRELDLTTHAIYIIMERATCDWDEEIRKRLEKKKPYSEEELIIIIKQLVEGLAYLQKNNISHRDIKPQNVLVFENNTYKVADFGEAKEIKIAKQLNTLRGTELYMSPILFEGLKENLDDVTHNTYKSDVFSLGYCFLYAATLTFNSIYDIRDVKEVRNINGILNKYLKNKYTSKIINLIIKMVDVNEQNRFDFLELENYLNENFL